MYLIFRFNEVKKWSCYKKFNYLFKIMIFKEIYYFIKVDELNEYE